MDKPRLLDQVRDALRVRHYSLRTETSYLQYDQVFYPVSRQASPST